jgi:hypothetical protein
MIYLLGVVLRVRACDKYCVFVFVCDKYLLVCSCALLLR